MATEGTDPAPVDVQRLHRLPKELPKQLFTCLAIAPNIDESQLFCGDDWPSKEMFSLTATVPLKWRMCHLT